MDLKGIMLSEISQEKTNTVCFTYIRNLKIKQNRNRLIDIENQLMAARGEGGRWVVKKVKGIRRCK